MSGHEKHYIPHDDLVELKTAIDSLETAVETLNTAIVTLYTYFLLPASEDWEQWAQVGMTANATDTIVDEVFSATEDIFIKRIQIKLLNTTANILNAYDSEVFLDIGGTASGVAITTPVFGDSDRPRYNATDWLFRKTWDISNWRLEAGDTLLILTRSRNIHTSTNVTVTIQYVTLGT